MKEIDVVLIGQRLKEARHSAGLTQFDLAKKVGCAPNTITQYEKGSCKMSVEVLIKICQILNESADYLLGIKDF